MAQLRASLSAAEGERDRLRGAAAREPKSARRDRAKATTLKIDLEKAATARAVAQIENLNQQIGALRRQIAALRGGARRVRAEGQGFAAAHRRSRPAAQRGAGAARAGTVALPLGLLRQAARHPRQPARHPRRRRPLRVPVRGVLRLSGKRRCGRKAAPSSTSSPARCSIWKSKFRPRSTGCCASTATPTRGRSAPRSPFKSNWELSAARAISVVQYLISKGVSPQRLVAAGFGEFQPIDPGTTDEAFSRNRRIELKLTER